MFKREIQPNYINIKQSVSNFTRKIEAFTRKLSFFFYHNDTQIHENLGIDYVNMKTKLHKPLAF